MEPAPNYIEIYQLRVVLRETSPHIWRRFLVRSDSSIVDLGSVATLAKGIMLNLTLGLPNKGSCRLLKYGGVLLATCSPV